MDEKALKIISSCLKMIELMEEGVTAIEKLELIRKPFPSMHTIYFISPTSESVSRVIEDFKDPKKPLYGTIHIFFTNHVPESIFK